MFGSSSQLDKHWFFNRAIALGSACSLELRKIDSIWMDHCMALYDIWACCLFWWLQEYTLGENPWKMYLRQEKELSQVLVTSIAEFLEDDMPICVSLPRFPLIPRRRSQSNILSRHWSQVCWDTFAGLSALRGYLRMTALLWVEQTRFGLMREG